MKANIRKNTIDQKGHRMRRRGDRLRLPPGIRETASAYTMNANFDDVYLLQLILLGLDRR